MPPERKKNFQLFNQDYKNLTEKPLTQKTLRNKTVDTKIVTRLNLDLANYNIN